ncbi:long-chain-fatty-acid--protein ligase [Reichenbachiella versicolor]|uniref:acyl transferase n=1 Tax=Reichenbachiella versicolor TaxID=1821036 RepID=UPI000D6E7866|nr:acyl transferase [Reichenbachiella versicolor]
MNELERFKNKVKGITNESFEAHAIELFQYQADNNSVYRQYLNNLNFDTKSVSSLEDIPFLPIEFFKNHNVVCGNWSSEFYFQSSGTTNSTRSKHQVQDLSFYREHALDTFKRVFKDFNKNDVVLALLPSYQAQSNSSLICMVDHFMDQVKESDYCLENFTLLGERINRYLNSDRSVYLFGVGYALLDFAEKSTSKIDGLKIIETGGMKGRRAEMTKEEYYNLLKNNLGEISILSEYGMTELMSQAYSLKEANYTCAHSMKVLVRDPVDPFSKPYHNKTGVLNVIDLANVHSCAFIETQDLGKVQENGQFQVLGRLDNSDLRGCNLLVQ